MTPRVFDDWVNEFESSAESDGCKAGTLFAHGGM